MSTLFYLARAVCVYGQLLAARGELYFAKLHLKAVKAENVILKKHNAWLEKEIER